VTREVNSSSFVGNKMKLFFFILNLIPILIFSQPSWIDFNARTAGFPSDSYAIGFSSRYFNLSENLNEVSIEVKNMSRLELSESIFVSIKSQSQLVLKQNAEEASIFFEKSAITKSSLVALGLKTEVYIDHNKRIAYGFSYIENKKLALGYHKILASNLNEIEDLLSEVNLLNNKKDRYNLLSQLSSKLKYTSGLQDLLIYLGIENETALMRSKSKQLKNLVNDQLAEIRNELDQTPEQMIRYFFEEMSEIVFPDLYEIKIQPISYKNSGIATELSHFLYEISQQEAATIYKLNNKFNSRYRLTGSYWLIDSKIQVSLNLHEYDGDEIIQMLHGGSFSIPINVIKSNDMKIIPENFELNQVRYKSYVENTGINGGLHAKLYSDKGAGPLIYEEGDTLSLLFSISRQAYIRILNIWNDGTQVLLMDNYFVDAKTVNENIKIPLNWITTCPCGTEYIKLIAQSNPFEPLRIENKEGLDFLQDNISDIMTISRNDQKINKKDNNFYFGESLIILTTIKK